MHTTSYDSINNYAPKRQYIQVNGGIKKKRNNNSKQHLYRRYDQIPQTFR
jgi:hypothetical protein